MAIVQLYSLTFTRSSTLPSFTSPLIFVTACRNFAALSHYSGLRLRATVGTVFSTRATSRIVAHGGRIACEAQDTAVKGYVSISLRRFVVLVLCEFCDVVLIC
ncbi:hypothetical protein LR48_Vigan03g200900 [Vigna angularis]|uniref:Uncharacterized protein n=1 Tax=Phaseolus angularis TaxID=3914 RepID=A0A0L9U7M3_PHAAN|nr:hypothetical protein LR48_Vigan03g200900 [Vigna angularis]